MTKGRGKVRTSRPAFKQTKFGVWAVSTILGEAHYLGTVEANSRVEAKRKAAELVTWKKYSNPDFEIRVGVLKI